MIREPAETRKPPSNHTRTASDRITPSTPAGGLIPSLFCPGSSASHAIVCSFSYKNKAEVNESWMNCQGHARGPRQGRWSAQYQLLQQGRRCIRYRASGFVGTVLLLTTASYFFSGGTGARSRASAAGRRSL